jgi:hypothetical protein
MNQTQKFCNIIRKRSVEHAIAMARLSDMPSMMISILRQELDSLIRAVYLNSLEDALERQRLINQTLDGDRWTVETAKGKSKPLTDREMVELCNEIFGWTEMVYDFGCSLVHLSDLHGVANDEDIENFFPLEISKDTVLHYLRDFHDGPNSDNPTLEEISEYFPEILKKIADNLEFYLKEIEAKE